MQVVLRPFPELPYPTLALQRVLPLLELRGPLGTCTLLLRTSNKKAVDPYGVFSNMVGCCV